MPETPSLEEMVEAQNRLVTATTAAPVPVPDTELPAHVIALREKLAVKPPQLNVEYVNALVYGEPGVGKTFLMGTADDDERTSPSLVFDVEGGMATLRRKPGIDVYPVRSMEDLTKGFETLWESITDGEMYYKTVGIDSLTELADLDLKDIMTKAYNANPDKIDKDVPDQRGYGKSRSHIRNIVRAFRDLPCNVIYIASIGTLQEEGQPNKVYPAFSGKLRTEVPGFMDIVGYLYNEVDPIKGDITRHLQVQGTRRVVAKDRTAALGGKVINPTIPMLWDLIHSPITSSDPS